MPLTARVERSKAHTKLELHHRDRADLEVVDEDGMPTGQASRMLPHIAHTAIKSKARTSSNMRKSGRGASLGGVRASKDYGAEE